MPNMGSSFVAILEWIGEQPDNVVVLLPAMNYGYQKMISGVIAHLGVTAIYYEDSFKKPQPLISVGMIPLTDEIKKQADVLRF